MVYSWAVSVYGSVQLYVVLRPRYKQHLGKNISGPGSDGIGIDCSRLFKKMSQDGSRLFWIVLRLFGTSDCYLRPGDLIFDSICLFVCVLATMLKKL